MQQCKCEHWQECPVCSPHRFDKDGNRLPPEPTPLQDARARLEAMESHAKRLALSLECLLLECKDIAAVSKWWDSSHAALTEYQSTIDRLYPQEHVSPLGSGEQQAEPVVVISPPVKLKYVISPKPMCWDDAMKWAADHGLRLATVDEMRRMSLPTDYYWSGTEYSQSNAWLFNTPNGFQNRGVKYIALFAVAVAHKQAINADDDQSMSGNPSY